MRRKVVAITLYDRTAEVVRAVMTGLTLPGNRPDALAVCYDRADQPQRDEVRKFCSENSVELIEAELTDPHVGPRCPSLAWNTILGRLSDDYVFCMSSDMVMAPHSVGMAYHLAHPGCFIVARAEHCGQSYGWTHRLPDDAGTQLPKSRTITCSFSPSSLGFAWLMPMAEYRKIGGFDEIFMGGYCYEDDDFVLRMWRAGANMVFCDDVMGFHLEHRRDHLRDADGKVSINEAIFVERWGQADYLSSKQFMKDTADSAFLLSDIGLGFFIHSEHGDGRMIRRVFALQKLYGQDEPWRAIKAEVL